MHEPHGIAMAQALGELVAILPQMVAALDRQAEVASRVKPMAYRLDQVAESLGVSRSTIERARREGRFPAPDASLGGKLLLWQPSTIREWLERGGRV